MRVLHLTSHLNVGGITSYVLSLSSALSLKGHDVLIASGGGELEERAMALGLSHWKYPLRTSASLSPQVLWSAWRLAQRMRRERMDVVHAHTRVGQVAASLLALWRGVPWVATWHGFYRRRLGRRLWPATGDLTIAISEPVRQSLIERFRVPAADIRLIPNGIEAAAFMGTPDPSAQARLRDRVRLPADARVIGTIARLVPSKGVEALIDALPHVRSAVPKTHLLVVGDGESRDSLARRAVERGVIESVHFAGTLPETRTALSLMEVFVFLPAREEGFGLSLLEAMAAARPIVAVRRGGGAPWVLQESGVGRLVEPGDARELARAIGALLTDRGAAAQNAAQGRVAVEARYTMARVAEQVEAVYQELVRWR